MLSKFDILEIIDKAIESKDRYVTVYIPKSGDVSVSVYPITDDEIELEKAIEDEQP